MESLRLPISFMTWGLGGECILLLGNTLARNTVRSLIILSVIESEVGQLDLWDLRNKTPKHSRIGESITSSTTTVTMKVRQERLLSRTLGIKQCRMH